ncbi:hypothetical protein J6590_072212 [Homalodisca vitripennis]|nr:hypothetical protein J6590_072212 [Homalodisca vitripennis]
MAYCFTQRFAYCGTNYAHCGTQCAILWYAVIVQCTVCRNCADSARFSQSINADFHATGLGGRSGPAQPGPPTADKVLSDLGGGKVHSSLSADILHTWSYSYKLPCTKSMLNRLVYQIPHYGTIA